MAMSGGTSVLVHTGYANGNTDVPIRLYVYWKSTQHTASNTSTITCGMYIVTKAGWPIGAWDDFYGSYVGTTSNTFDGTVPYFDGTYWLAENKSFTVSHEANGTCKPTIYWKLGVNSTWGGFTKPSGSFKVTLPTIPRESDVSVSASSVRMGTALGINITRASTSFTHTLRYAFNGASGTIASNVGIAYSWTVPTSLASNIPNKTSGSGTIYCDTYSGSTKIGTTSTTFTANVPAATTPTLSASSVAMGSSVKITMSRAASSFTHKLTYSFGSVSETIGTDLGTSKTWTVPLSLASEIPTRTSGTITISCITYNGTASVGTKSVQLTATVPDNDTTKPTASMTISPVSSLPSSFSGIYIRGKTKVKADFTASSTYSSISSYKLSVDGMTASGDPSTSGYLTSSGTLTVTGTVKDARGYARTLTQSIVSVPYSHPKVIPYTGKNKAICERCLADGTPASGGLYLLIKAGRSYSTVEVDGVQKNFCTLQYRYKTSSSTSYSVWSTLISGSDTSTNEVSTVLPDIVSSATTSYDVQLCTVDTAGSETHLDFVIPTDDVSLHMMVGGKGVAVGKYAEKEGFEVADDWPSYFPGNVYGRIFSLGKLTKIPDNDDFNNYKDFGVYAVASNATAATISNIPEARAGKLVVSSANGSGANTGNWAYVMQEFLPYEGKRYYYRTVWTNGSGEWTYPNWGCRGDRYWESLGLSSDVSSSSSNMGRFSGGCHYRVVNENHVYVAFNCAFSYEGSPITVSANQIPSPYKPARNVYTMCTVNNRGIARVFVNSSGDVRIDHVQDMASAETTSAYTASWIDGYIDYWV